MKVVRWSRLTGRQHTVDIDIPDLLPDTVKQLPEQVKEFIEEGNLPDDYDVLANREQYDME